MNRKQKAKRFKKEDNIYRPMTPHESRLASYTCPSVPPEDSLEGFILKRKMEKDIGFKILMRKIEADINFIRIEAALGGSGLYMSKLLRGYIHEFYHRFNTCGPKGFPLSFNILEAFFNFEHLPAPFKLHREYEHLLKLEDFLIWGQKKGFSNPLLEISSLLKEGEIYSFNFLPNSHTFNQRNETDFVIAGISIVRHEHELSCVLLTGESPPSLQPNCDTDMATYEGMPAEKENLKIDPTLTEEDSLLEGYPDHGRVILLSRINLASSTHDVRYILRDLGNSYSVSTDDPSGLEDLNADDRESLLTNSQSVIENYSELFSLFLTLIQIPIYLHDRQSDVTSFDVFTEYGSEKTMPSLRKQLKDWQKEIDKTKSINGLTIWEDDDPYTLEVSPPDIIFETTGYWKPLSNNQFGVDAHGNTIAGKTWVSRKDSWETPPPESFFIRKRTPITEGDNPGHIYIMRSPSHEPDIYKIGLTTNEPKDRAKQLNKTATPLPFEVIASWQVGDCKSAEAEIHRLLEARRINPRREFFHAPLQEIIQIVSSVCNLA